MSTELLGAKVNDAGELIFDAEPKARKAFFAEFYRTPEGREFLKYRTPESIDRVIEVIERLYAGDADITIDKFRRAVRMLIDVKDPAVIPTEELPTEDVRPRDPQTGRFLSEYEVWAGDPTRSMDQIRSRANSDPNGFGKWFRDQYRQQIQQEGAYKIAGAPERQPTQADEQVLLKPA
jgi:hypothetical protein